MLVSGIFVGEILLLVEYNVRRSYDYWLFLLPLTDG